MNDPFLNGCVQAGRAARSINVSKSPAVQNHDNSEWNPSPRSGPTRRCKLIFAGQSRRMKSMSGFTSRCQASCLGTVQSIDLFYVLD